MLVVIMLVVRSSGSEVCRTSPTDDRRLGVINRSMANLLSSHAAVFS